MFIASYFISALVSYLGLTFFDYRRGSVLAELQKEDPVVTSLFPLVNSMIAAYALLVLLVVGLINLWRIIGEKLYSFKLKTRNKKVIKKEKKLRQKEIEGLKKEGNLFYYIELIVEVIREEKTDHLETQGKQLEIQRILSKTMNKIKKNKDEAEFLKLTFEYEKVFENIYNILLRTRKIKDSLTLEVIEEVLDIAKTFETSFENEEKRILGKLTEGLEFEKEYLKKINN